MLCMDAKPHLQRGGYLIVPAEIGWQVILCEIVGRMQFTMSVGQPSRGAEETADL